MIGRSRRCKWNGEYHFGGSKELALSYSLRTASFVYFRGIYLYRQAHR
jgi:hypothetical protein